MAAVEFILEFRSSPCVYSERAASLLLAPRLASLARGRARLPQKPGSGLRFSSWQIYKVSNQRSTCRLDSSAFSDHSKSLFMAGFHFHTEVKQRLLTPKERTMFKVVLPSGKTLWLRIEALSLSGSLVMDLIYNL